MERIEYQPPLPEIDFLTEEAAQKALGQQALFTLDFLAEGEDK